MASLDTTALRKHLARATAVAARWRFAMGSLVDSTTLLRLLLAFALALGLWIYVTLRNNPDTTQTLRARPIQLRGLATGLIVTTSLPTADITLAGPSVLIGDASAVTEPYVDLTDQAVASG
jgi:hypothetical protein